VIFTLILVFLGFSIHPFISSVLTTCASNACCTMVNDEAIVNTPDLSNICTHACIHKNTRPHVHTHTHTHAGGICRLWCWAHLGRCHRALGLNPHDKKLSSMSPAVNKEHSRSCVLAQARVACFLSLLESVFPWCA